MSQSIDLEKLEKESRRLFSEDGMLYIFLGLLLLLVGVGFAVPGLVGLIGLAAFLIYPLELLRRRITYPRVGYAKFSAPPGFLRGLLGFMAVVLTGLFVIAFVGDGRFQFLLPLAISVVFALALFFGVSSHGPQLIDWILIGLSLIVGVYATWRYEDWHDGTAVLFGVVGAVAMVIGLIKLQRFLQKYPLPEEREES